MTVIFLVFAANNHDAITVGLFPLPYTMTLPKFLFAIVCFTLGVVVGSFMINLKLNKTHRKYKSEHRRVVALQNEISAMNRQPQKLMAASSKG
jgi:uncharacterized integral membrane protein